MRWMIGFLSLILVACGGGDDGGDPATQSPTPASTVAVTQAPVLPTETNNPAAQSTTDPGGATTASACPNAEFPAVGALSIIDGAIEWSVCSPDEAYRTVIGASDDIVLIEESVPIDQSGSANRRTIAFDAADGSERWSRSTGDTPTPAGPFDGQGIVVLADQDAGALVGVDALTGEEQWRVESNEVPLANSLTVAVVGDMTSPLTGSGNPSRVRGIDRVTGDELWGSVSLPSGQSGAWVGRSPAAVLGEVVVVPTGANVTAIDMRTGEMLWQEAQLDHLGAADGTIVGTGGTNGPNSLVTAMEAASGRQLWTASGSESYGGLLAVGDGVIAVLDAGGLEFVAYELSSGDERWRATRTSGTQPQLIDGTSLVMLWEGELSILSTTEGATVWSATEPFGSPLMNSVGSNGDSVFVAINSLPWTD